MIYWELFQSFFQIGLFSIGGGYAAMPLIQRQAVELHNWLTMSQFADIIAVAEMTPGPIALNSATFVGMQVAGFGGALVATAGCVFPSCIIVTFLAYIYSRFRMLHVVQGVFAGLRPAVAAMITSATVSMLNLSLWNGGSFAAAPDWIAVAIFAAALILLHFRKTSPIRTMAFCGAAGVLLYSVL